MGDAFIVRHGGNPLSNAYAVILVSYPAGSICTCTNGVTILSAGNSCGAWAFGVPEAGTWTISCTDGSKSTAKNVLISNQYQAENISLTYERILFDHSTDSFADISQHFISYYMFEGELTDSFPCVRTGGAAFGWDIGVDLTPYSELVLYGHIDDLWHYSRTGQFGICNIKAEQQLSVSEMPSANIFSQQDISEENGCFICDVSNINQVGYFFVQNVSYMEYLVQKVVLR